MQFYSINIVKGDKRFYKMTFPIAVVKDGKTIEYSFDSVCIALQSAIVRLAQEESIVLTGMVYIGLQIAQAGNQVKLIRSAVFEGSLILTPASEELDSALKKAINQVAADVAATFNLSETSMSYHNEKWQLLVGQDFNKQ